MSDIVLPMVSTMGPWSPFYHLNALPSSATANTLALYYPVVIPVTCVARRVWWANGATVSGSYNLDAGIYADNGRKPGARLVSSGNTAQGTANQVQFADITDTTLAPGLYWLAISTSTASATLFRVTTSTNAITAQLGFEQGSGNPLPATATPVERTSSSIYLFGFATTASP